ncbi:MAG: hypothetical protein WDN10_01220 [bacterium]
MSTLSFDSVFPNGIGSLACEVPLKVKKGISRRLRSKKLILVSAVCPDYARSERGFTYMAVSGGIPHIAKAHLEIVHALLARLQEWGIDLEYHVTLADTEYDLPFVMRKMVDGDPLAFLERCQSSCERIIEEASRRSLPLKTCRRFTRAFPTWFTTYHAALAEVRRELESDSSVRMNVDSNAGSRIALYQAMTSETVTHAYCREMAIRQLAQYMAWGRLAEEVFGTGAVMINHSTPNLSRVNHPFSREGKEAIPILQLAQSTMPVTGD